MQIALFLICAVVAFAIAIRRPVLEGRFLPKLRRPYLLLAAPDDMYKVLLVVPFGAIDDSKQFSFRHKYAGEYVIDMVVEKPIPSLLPSDLGVVDLLLTFRSQGRDILSTAVGAKLSPWWSWDKKLSSTPSWNKNGFTLLRYEVPKDLPRAVDIEVNIRIRQITDKFAADFQPSEIRVGKLSEE